MVPLGNNAKYLIQALKKESLIDNRFEKLELKNVDLVTLLKEGCFSLVYKAFDKISGKFVALKFFDPVWMNDKYRLDSFHREHQILMMLLKQNRCLQVSSGLLKYALRIDLPGGDFFELSCPYFAVEWVEGKIEPYFLQQDAFDAATKLRLFNEVVLSVEALHAREVFHRDLKADNMRATSNSQSKQGVVAIDFGTAARSDSPLIGTIYGERAVGAPWYASPEARCGLAGNRAIAKFTDVYALGCLLFELFNLDYFFKGMCTQNPHYETVLSALGMHLIDVADPQQQLLVWRKALNRFSGTMSAVKIDGPGHNVPPAIVAILNELLAILTHVDFEVRDRPLSWVRKRIWSAIRVVENDELSRRRLRAAKAQRQIRIEKALAREQRLDTWLTQRKSLC